MKVWRGRTECNEGGRGEGGGEGGGDIGSTRQPDGKGKLVRFWPQQRIRRSDRLNVPF